MDRDIIEGFMSVSCLILMRIFFSGFHKHQLTFKDAFRNGIYVVGKIVIFVILLHIASKSDIYSKHPNIIAGILFLVLFLMIIEPKVIRYIKENTEKNIWNKSQHNLS